MEHESAIPGRRSGPSSRPAPRERWLAALAAAALLAAPTAAELEAQGFSLNEYGACGMARGGATVADACGDGSSIAYNPAGLADLEGFTASAGALLVATGGGFTDDFTGAETDLDTDPDVVRRTHEPYAVKATGCS